MNKQEKLKVYEDCQREILILEQGDSVDFCNFENPFGCGFMVERLPDDEQGKLFDVNGYLMRKISEIFGIVYRFVMSEEK